MRVEAATPGELEWLVERTEANLTDCARGIKAVDSSGRIRGMVAYDNWTHNAVQAHMAVDFPGAWRSLLRPAFSYPFEEAGKGVLLGIIPADNERSCRMTEAMCFRLAHVIEDGWREGVDLRVYQMRREECPWIARPSIEKAVLCVYRHGHMSRAH